MVSNNSKGLVMYDSDYIAAASHIENHCNALVEIINEYTNILKAITEEAIVDQKICSAISKLSNQTTPLIPIIVEIKEQVTNSSREFVCAVDAADSFLY